MSFVSDIFSSDKGAGFQAGGVPITQAVTPEQTAAAYAASQQGLTQQQAFLQALQQQNGIGAQVNALGAQQGLQSQMAAQNGVGNQSQAYDTQLGTQQQLQGQNGIGNQSAALGAQAGLAGQLQQNNGAGNMGSAFNQQQAFVNAIGGQNGIGNQSQVFNQQQALAGQMQGVADGTGPNPALAQLNQSTGQNVAQQAALMASQRGAGANVGLVGRQAAMQGSGIQQQAAGQAATMQAQQQLAGMQALAQQQQALGATAGAQVANQGNQQAQLASLASNQVSQQAAQQQAVAALASQQVGQQLGQQQAVASLAGQQVGQQQAQNAQVAAITGQMVANQGQAGVNYSSAAQNEQQNLLNSVAQNNNANVAMQSNINNANAGVAGTNAGSQAGILGGALSAVGSALPLLGGGGTKPTTTDGGRDAGGGISSGGGNDFGGGSTGTAMVAHGGLITPSSGVRGYADGGMVAQEPVALPELPALAPMAMAPIAPTAQAMPAAAGPSSNVGKFLVSNEPSNNPAIAAPEAAPGPTFAQKAGGAGIMGGVMGLAGGAMKAMGKVLPVADKLNVPGNWAKDAYKRVAKTPDGKNENSFIAKAMYAGLGKDGWDTRQGDDRGYYGADRAPSDTPPPTQAMAKGGKVTGPKLAADKKTVPGKAKVKGANDSYANDTVDAKLSPGEIVLPRSVTMSADPVGNAAKFVQAIMAKQQMHKGRK